MDLMSPLNWKMWCTALSKCCGAVQKGWLRPVEEGFVRQMAEEHQMNGQMFEPTVKQFNWLRQIASDLEKL